MVPRTAIVGVRPEATRDGIVELLRRQPHTRYPILTGPDVEVSGYVVARDLYAALLEGEVDVLRLKRNVPFLPEAIPAVQALRQLQAARTPLGIVVDESGGVAGLVTIEDVTEELVGDILAEHEAPTFLVHSEGDGAARVSGGAPVHEVNRALGLQLPERAGYATMAGLVLDRAQHIPTTGELIELAPDVTAEILDASPRAVRWLRLRYARTPSVD
jgi:putative hemolysin